MTGMFIAASGRPGFPPAPVCKPLKRHENSSFRLQQRQIAIDTALSVGEVPRSLTQADAPVWPLGRVTSASRHRGGLARPGAGRTMQHHLSFWLVADPVLDGRVVEGARRHRAHP